MPVGTYQLEVFGSACDDVSGNELDGSGAGTPGSDYVRTFTILPAADHFRELRILYRSNHQRPFRTHYDQLVGHKRSAGHVQLFHGDVHGRGRDRYQTATGTATIQPGSSSVTIDVPVNGQPLYGPSKSFSFTISNVTNVTQAGSQFTAPRSLRTRSRNLASRSQVTLGRPPPAGRRFRLS